MKHTSRRGKLWNTIWQSNVTSWKNICLRDRKKRPIPALLRVWTVRLYGSRVPGLKAYRPLVCRKEDVHCAGMPCTGIFPSPPRYIRFKYTENEDGHVSFRLWRPGGQAPPPTVTPMCHFYSCWCFFAPSGMRCLNILCVGEWRSVSVASLQFDGLKLVVMWLVKGVWKFALYCSNSIEYNIKRYIYLFNLAYLNKRDTNISRPLK